MKASEQFVAWPELERALGELRLAIEDSDVGAVLKLLRRLVPEYAPDGDVVDWVHLQTAG